MFDHAFSGVSKSLQGRVVGWHKPLSPIARLVAILEEFLFIW